MQEQRFDISGITDDQFFEQAQAKVVEALRKYAEHSQNGQRLQRRLFAEDSVKGFAFVEICHTRFDAVLMNPPFGMTTAESASYIAGEYATWNKNVLCAFVERGTPALIRFWSSRCDF